MNRHLATRFHTFSDTPRPGSKHHLLTDARGIPLSAILTAANENDVTQLVALVDRIVPVRGRRGPPRQRPEKLFAERAYDSKHVRVCLRLRSIQPKIARRGAGHGSGLGIYRWVAERSFAWLHQFRRLRVRFERRAETHEAFLNIGCALICWNLPKASLC